MRYRAINLWWLVNPETWEIVNIEDRRRGVEIDIPYFLWEYDSVDTCYMPGSSDICHRTYKMELNNLEIAIPVSEGTGTIARFTAKGQEHKIKVMKSHIMTPYTALHNIHTTNYACYVDDECKEYATSHWSFSNEFKFIKGLLSQYPTKSCKDRLFFGIKESKYHLVYRETPIQHDCYALLMGTWAILLTDKFEFDSLVVLREANQVELVIDSIVYTMSPYMTKIMVMVK